MPAGRPLKFKTPAEMQAKIDAYFDHCDEVGEPYTITGLALALDTYRDVLIDYQNKDEYSNAVKRAKQRCENFAEKRIYADKNAAGPIFALKNYGWKDKTETDITSKGEQLGSPDPVLAEKFREFVKKETSE